MDYCPPPGLMSPAERKRVGEAVREVFPKLTEKQLGDVIEAVGGDTGRCLQHILDHPQRYLLCDEDPPKGPPAPSSKEQQEKRGEDWKTAPKTSPEESTKEKNKKEMPTRKQEDRRKRELNDLNNFFADIFSGAETGSVIFKGSFHGSKGKVLESSQGDAERETTAEGDEEDFDLVLAHALQAMEDDAYRAMKRIEEEDERLARELDRQEREGSGQASEARTTEPPAASLPADRTARRRLISSQESQEAEAEEKKPEETSDKGDWRKLVRQDSLTERDRRLALKLFNDEMEQEKLKRKREEEDEALAKSMQSGDASPKRRRVELGGEELTTDEAIVKLLQEEEEETYRREREKKAREEEEQSRKLIEELMRQEDMEHDDWVRSELAKIDASEKKSKKSLKWPGFGFGFGDKERMREKIAGKIKGDQDWKSSRFFPSTAAIESFLRSRARSGGSVTITNVMKYDLVQRFERKWEEFRAMYGPTSAEGQPSLGFHGTRGELIPSITSRGLLVPGTAAGVEHVTDSGWWGGGIYLSPNPEVSAGYAADGKMLVCSVLMGRIFHCENRMDGEGCVFGYDSHMSPCGQEMVLFDAAQVLPCYLITFDGDGEDY